MNEKGVAVIMAMWLLAVLAIIGTTFAYMMRLEPIIARTHRDDMKALYVAQAGIDHAVCILKQDADRTIDHLDETWASGLTDQVLLDEAGYSVGYYTVTISDENSKINLNNINTGHPDVEGYGGQKELLMGLPEIGEAKAKNIIDYQKDIDHGPFEYNEEVMCVSAVGAGSYSAVKDLITCYSLLDTSTQKTREDRAPININTATETILEAVLEPIDDVGPATLDTVVTGIITKRTTDPFNDQNEFNTFIDGLSITSPRKNKIKDNADPTSTTYGETSYSCWTTEFSFKSDGSFAILSTGKYVSPSGQETVKKIRVVVDRGAPGDESRIKYYKEEAEEQ